MIWDFKTASLSDNFIFLLAVGGIGRDYAENKKKTAKREPIEKNKTKQKANAKNQNHRLIHEH